MKLTKKILSLVLAAALLLGTVAVAAQADGLTAYEGSKLTYVISSDKTVDGATYVMPGETITIQVNMSTNYYTGSNGGEFFLWTSGIFEELGENYTVSNFATEFTNTYTNPAITTSYPSTHKAADYVGFQAVRINKANVTTPQVLDNVLVYEFKLTVLNDESLIGKKAVFEIPAGSVKSPTLTSRKGMIYQAVSSTTDSITDVKGYAETVDLTAASLTINIGSNTEYCDYSALETAVAKAPEYAEEYYDAEVYAAWEAAVEEGNTLLDAETKLEKSDENQKTINDAAALVKSTYEALVPSFLSLAKLNAAVTACTTPAYGEEYYNAEDYSAWNAALAAATKAQADYNETMPATKQAEVDAIANELTAAYAKLVPAEVDLTKLNNAVANCSTPAYAAEYYDAEDYSAWEAALADAVAAQTSYAGKPATYQAEVDDIADTLTAAYAKLVPAEVDLTKLNNAVTDCSTPAYEAEYYDAEDYSAYAAALAEAVAAQTSYAGKPETYQAEVDAIADKLTTAYNALVPSFVDCSAIKEALDKYAATEYTAEYYDADEYAAYEAALAAAETADFEGKADTEANRAAVAKIAEDLESTHTALDARFVDLTPVKEALAECVPTYGEEYYDAEAYAAYETEVTASTNLISYYENIKPDTATYRNDVALFAEALRNAYAALEPAFVSYAKLEAALEAYGTTEYPQNAYKAETWADYADALAAANTANERPEVLAPASDAEAQAAIDNAAAALETAYKALELAKSSIISVTAMQENYVKGDVVNFEFLCEGTNFSKVQVITESGVTATYHRTHPSVKEIRTEGEYEIWVVALKIPSDETVVRYAKAKLGLSWDNGMTAFTMVPTVQDYAVKSVEVLVNGEAATEFVYGDVATIKIVTGPATRRIRLVNSATGTTATYTTPAEVNLDGTKVWLITRTYAPGTFNFDIYAANSSNVLVDSGADVSFTVTKVVVSQVPSTGNVEDAVFAASVAKARILKGSTQTFTIATDKDAKAVRLVGPSGNASIKATECVSEDDTAKTWVITATYASEGEYSYTVEALYGNTWIEGAENTAVSFKVIY